MSFYALCRFTEGYLTLDPTSNKYSDLISYLSFIKKTDDFFSLRLGL